MQLNESIWIIQRNSDEFPHLNTRLREERFQTLFALSKLYLHFCNFLRFVHYFFRIFALKIRKQIPDISCKMCIKCSSVSTSIIPANAQQLLHVRLFLGDPLLAESVPHQPQLAAGLQPLWLLKFFLAFIPLKFTIRNPVHNVNEIAQFAKRSMRGPQAIRIEA